MLIGNLTRDPEVRYTPQNTAVASFVIATNREWKVEGETKQVADFHNVVAWNKLAEICGQLLTKGTKVYVEGRLQTRSWDDATSGSKKYKTEVVVEDMIVLTPKGGNGESEMSFDSHHSNESSSSSEEINFDDINLDDLDLDSASGSEDK